MFKPRTLAIAGSIAALSVAATPLAQVASAHTTPAKITRADYSRDASSVRHVDLSREVTLDKSHVDYSRDLRDR
jgi:hypothetical protein